MDRDLKLENLLVNDDTVKIADFGMANWGGHHGPHRRRQLPDHGPQLYLTEQNVVSYTSKADLWSIGFIS